ncbi:MAG TPA: glycerophosphodiester phosphodiesterase [Vicinamibacteria bacterium]|nr:glycerophosphodiester phosphodiesterase [Vicinamibacteria bacterium]
MGAFKWLWRVLALLLILYAYFAWLHPVRGVADHPFFGEDEPVVIAHQGGRGLWPENTLLAFEKADALGVDMIEMDLRSTADGEIVVIHDATVDRTTNGQGRVGDLASREVLQLDAAFAFEGPDGSFPYRDRGITVPSLASVLAKLPHARLNVEMKEFTPELARQLCGSLKEFAAEHRVLVAAFEHDAMTAFREDCPEVATSATAREGLFFYQAHRLGLGSLYRSPAVVFQVPEFFGDIHVIDASFLEWTRRTNVRVQAWTVNDPKDMERLLEMGVSGILTDYPDRLLELLGRL